MLHYAAALPGLGPYSGHLRGQPPPGQVSRDREDSLWPGGAGAAVSPPSRRVLSREGRVAPQTELCVGFRASLGAQGRSPSLTEDASRKDGTPLPDATSLG